MNPNMTHSVLTSKSNNDNLISQNIGRSIMGRQKYTQQKDQKISIQLQLMRLQQQHRKQITLWEQQTHQMRVELERQQEMLQDAQNRQLQQKQQLNTMHKENLKLFQQNEKNKKLINTLKSDNQSLQLQIERWKSDRKTYSAKLDSIYELKKNVNMEILQKNTLIEEQQGKIRQLEKKLTQYKLKTEQLSGNLSEKQRDNKELSTEVRSHLQSFLETQNLVSRLQHQLHETNQLNMTLKDKINQIEKDKEILLQRIYNLGGDNSDRQDQKEDEQDNPYFNPSGRQTKKQSKLQSPDLENIISPFDERLMLEIQSFMRQFQSLLERKSEERQMVSENNEKLINSIECLEKNL